MYSNKRTFFCWAGRQLQKALSFGSAQVQPTNLAAVLTYNQYKQSGGEHTRENAGNKRARNAGATLCGCGIDISITTHTQPEREWQESIFLTTANEGSSPALQAARVHLQQPLRVRAQQT